MPIVHIHMLEGRTLEQKRKLVKSVTEAVVNSLGVDPDIVMFLRASSLGIIRMARNDVGEGYETGINRLF